MASSSSSSKPKILVHRLVGADFLPTPKGPKLRPLILEDDSPEKKQRAPQSNIYKFKRRRALAILNSPDHAPLQQLITNLDSSRVNKRLYTFCKSNYPNALSLKLSHLFLNSPNNPDIRSNCALLLHHLLDSPHFWDSTSHVIRSKLKIAILEILKQDNPKDVCKVMWKMASRIFTCIIINKEGDWPDMLSFFCESLNSGTLYVQDYAVMFFLELPTRLREELSQYVRDLRLNFWNIFDSSNGERKLYALAALIHLVRHMSGDYYSQFRDLLMPMVKAVSDFLDNDATEDNAQMILVKLAELSEGEPRFFDVHLNHVFDAMVNIGVNDNLDEHTRYLAVEALWQFDGTAIEKLDKTILGRLFHLLILVISRVSSDRCDYMIAEDFAHRICRLRGVELEFDLVIQKLLSYMASKDWRKHYTAISVICINAQECPEAMSDNIPEVMKVISQSTSDPSQKIVTAALRTVYFLSVFLPRHTLEEHFDFIITVLQSALADGSAPDNQVLAASAMRSLSDHCSLFILEPHLETTVSKLLQLLQSEHVEVQEEALNTLSSFGKLSKETFGKCYHMVITCLKQHLTGLETNREQNCVSGSKRQA